MPVVFAVEKVVLTKEQVRYCRATGMKCHVLAVLMGARDELCRQAFLQQQGCRDFKLNLPDQLWPMPEEPVPEEDLWPGDDGYEEQELRKADEQRNLDEVIDDEEEEEEEESEDEDSDDEEGTSVVHSEMEEVSDEEEESSDEDSDDDEEYEIPAVKRSKIMSDTSDSDSD